ncbi:tetratricopeptide repeat protein [Yoonia sp.]|uniref:tetratricopeptide repeat protein n=1 Tax=Yoonia sp. TaxID=2212373 RepID=UPI001A0FF866|nr:tetratricopeptide repeat protein [Yoonia sp.]MBE0414600.1 hypothetical protein [Yoonia sp.]
MSNADSFINEVTEEVRREKLYGYLRRYGWVAVVCVLVLVGGAAWFEYRNAQDRAAAEARGDALLAALNVNDPAARVAAFAQIGTGDDAGAITGLLLAAMQQEAGDAEAARETLIDIAGRGTVPQMYRDLATFKAAMLPTRDAADRVALLTDLAAPGQPYRLLALEQLAYLSVESGDRDAALGLLRQIEEDADVSRGLQERVQMAMLALDAPLPDAITE